MISIRGWSNCETKLVIAAIRGSPPDFGYWLAMAKSVLNDSEDLSPEILGSRSVVQCAASQLAEMLRWDLVDSAPTIDGVHGVLMSSVFSQVDWGVIAMAFIRSVESGLTKSKV